MTAHDHRVVVPGCYRCELNADEMDPRFDVKTFSDEAKTAAREAREAIRARFPHMHQRDENNMIRVPDLTVYSNAYLRRLADEAERIITERVNDGVFS